MISSILHSHCQLGLVVSWMKWRFEDWTIREIAQVLIQLHMVDERLEAQLIVGITVNWDSHHIADLVTLLLIDTCCRATVFVNAIHKHCSLAGRKSCKKSLATAKLALLVLGYSQVQIIKENEKQVASERESPKDKPDPTIRHVTFHSAPISFGLLDTITCLFRS